MITLHGVPKVGKTQLVDSFPGPVQFIATEHGHKYIRKEHKEKLVYLPSGESGWQKLITMLDKKVLLKRKPKTVAVDTTSKLYDRCMEWTCKKNNWEHAADAPHGKGWYAVRLEFGKQLERLADQCAELNATLIFVDHTEAAEVELAVERYHKMQCKLPGQARGVVLPASDHIWFLGYEHNSDDNSVDTLEVSGHNRWLWLAGSEYIEAGTRDKELSRRKHFVVKNLPEEKPYEYLTKYVNN